MAKEISDHHLKRPYKITLATVPILGVAALVSLLFVQHQQIKRLKLEIETAKAKTEKLPKSPYASASDFAKHAGKLREQVLLEIEPQVFAPTSAGPIRPRYPWKTNIVTTVF